MSNTDKNIDVFKQAAEYILAGKTEKAGAVMREGLPFVPIKKEPRSSSAGKQMVQFFKDGFIDRYFGTKLINPGMLRILSEKLPKKLTFESNGETFESLVIYKDFQPSLDHIKPISRGGEDKPSNWATTSVKGNSAKSIYTLEQLNWHLYPEGDICEWDGLSRLFVEMVDKEPELKRIQGVSGWYNATKHVLEKAKNSFYQSNKGSVYTDKNADVLKQAAEFLLAGKLEEAGLVIQECYSFISTRRESRQYSAVEQIRQFFKDGFIDRYFGSKLINPGMLRLFSEKLPEEFPYHPHWKTDVSHIAYWDYQPTIDHIVPITRGGKNDAINFATTSMKGNLAKKNYTLEQLNWHLYPEGDIRDWDGLSWLFVEIVKKEPELLQVNGIKFWYKATKSVIEEYLDDLFPARKDENLRTIPSKQNCSNGRSKIISEKVVNNGDIVADKQSFLNDIRYHTAWLSETAINAMSDILSLFEKICERYNARLIYSKSEKARRIIATVRNNEKKAILAEYSNGEIWFTNQGESEYDEIKAYTRRVLQRLINEKLFKKTEKNLSGTQWGVILTGSKRDASLDKNIIRFIEILKEEIK